MARTRFALVATRPGRTPALDAHWTARLGQYLTQRGYEFAQCGDMFIVKPKEPDGFTLRLIAQRFGQTQIGVLTEDARESRFRVERLF